MLGNLKLTHHIFNKRCKPTVTPQIFEGDDLLLQTAILHIFCLARVERLFIGCVANLSPVDVQHSWHTNYDRAGRLLNTQYHHLNRPTCLG
jgi:hypothetical protein